MKKRTLFVISLLLSIGLLLAACAPEVVTKEIIVTQEVEKEVVVTQEVEVIVTKEVEVEVLVTEEPEPEPEPSEPITISFWYAIGGSRGELLQAMINEFNETNEYQITVDATYSGNYGDTAQKTLAGLESGELPNGGVIPAGPLWTCREGNFLIEEYINGPEGLNMDDYWPVLWDYNKYEDHICSLPFNNSTMVMYYNKDLMAQAGLDPEAPPQTWDELVEQASTVVAAVPGTVGVEVRDEDWWLKGLILQNGGQIMNEDSTAPTFASEAGYGAMEFWKKLIDEGLMPPVQHGDSRDLFLAGQVAFWMSSTGNIGRAKDGAQFAWGTDFLPGNVQPGSTVGGAALVMFPEDEAHELATWRFMKWLVSADNSATWTVGTGYVPIMKEAAKSAEIQYLFSTEPYYETGFRQLEHASQYLHFWEMGTLDNLLADAIEQVELEVLSPQEALDNAAAELTAEMGN